MDEHSHLERLRSAPGDAEILQNYAQWLSANSDPRGEYLTAELALRDTEARMRQLQAQMYELTVLRGLDLNWLDTVLPLTVKAPTAGTFYTSSSPDESPFAKPGDPCSPETIVGILEVMRVPNQIQASHAGYVAEVVVSNGQPVECGAPLIRLTRLSPT